MSEGINRVTLLGNIGADPEFRTTQGGQAVLNIRLATSESYLDANKERQERTEWHRVVVWGKRAGALGRMLTKGERILVEGRISTRSYDDKDGQKRYQTDITATNVVLCGSGRGGQRASEAPASDEEQPYADSEGPPF